MSSNKSSKWTTFLTACLNCFPKKTPPTSPYPGFLSVPYNTHAAPNNESHLPTRPRQHSARVEYDPSGLVSIEPQSIQSPYLKADESAYIGSTRSGRMMSNQPNLAFQGRSERPRDASGNTGEDPRDDWGKTTLTASQVTELFQTIHIALAHVPYTICGMGALYDHGFTERRVKSVSLLCPAHAKDNVRAWLASKGYESYADSVGIPISGSANGRMVVRARIKYLDEGFHKLERVRSSVSQAWVLGLASQLDHAAAGYVDHHRRLQRRLKKESEGKGKGVDRGDGKEEIGLKAIARDVFWCLEKGVRTKYKFQTHLLPTLLSQEFWVAFTERNPEARAEMTRAGVNVEAVEARHRDEADIREHNAMLSQYGMGADNDETGPFDGMRTLANSKSVYTIRPTPASTINSNNEVLPSPVPALSPGPGSEGKLTNKFLARLMPQRSRSAREPRSTPRGEKEYGRSLTRSASSKSAPAQRPVPPPQRFSNEAERPKVDWI